MTNDSGAVLVESRCIAGDRSKGGSRWARDAARVLVDLSANLVSGVTQTMPR